MSTSARHGSGPSQDHAAVFVPPPLIYLVPLAAGFFLHWQRPWRFGASGAVLSAAGALLIAVGVALPMWAVASFRSRHTTVLPAFRPTTTIVDAGPYRLTRNPMYLGLALTYAGVALVGNSVWPIVMLPAVVLVVDRYVIQREERYLRSKFGAAYDDYRARVRRWL